MGFCDRTGLRMPVYYEPHGFSPEDKLHDWARAKPSAELVEKVRARVRGLRRQWVRLGTVLWHRRRWQHRR